MTHGPGQRSLDRLESRIADLSDEGRAELSRVLAGRGLLTEQDHLSLVAYYATRDGAEIDPSGLKAFLQGSLPAYMVPSHFQHVSELPRTHRGKINRDGLPDPTLRPASPAANTTQGAVDLGGRQLEAAVTALWAEVLGFDRIEPDDSFFEIGGDSLLGIQLLGKIRDQWQIDLSMEALFDHPTVRATAAHLSAVLWARDSSQADEHRPPSEETEEVEF